MTGTPPEGPGARAPGPGTASPPASRRALFALGAYGLYPLLALSGGVLLARAEGLLALAAASALLGAALLLPAWLGAVCRRCGERPLPRLLRLLLLPAAVSAALASRAASRPEQFLAFGLVGASAVMFGLGWRLAGRKAGSMGRPPPR